MKQKTIILCILASILAGCGFNPDGPSPSNCYGNGQPGCIEKYGQAKSIIVKAQK